MAKERLDNLLVKRKLIESHEKAKRMIMDGLVFSKLERLDKPGMKVDENIPLTVKGTLKYVSRGGYKLEKALTKFNTSVQNKVIVDIGSSTGGFTDCALQNGAKLIYAIDVGYNQLDWKLRNDSRVIVKEKTNFRYVTKELFTEGLPNFCMIDVSFISLRLILPVLKTILQNNSEVITLIKPQFEAKREQVGKKGVIKDKKVHYSVINHISEFAEKEGFQFLDVTYSPITGSTGNIEFLGHFGYKMMAHNLHAAKQLEIKNVVRKAHDQLRGKGEKE